MTQLSIIISILAIIVSVVSFVKFSINYKPIEYSSLVIIEQLVNALYQQALTYGWVSKQYADSLDKLIIELDNNDYFIKEDVLCSIYSFIEISRECYFHFIDVKEETESLPLLFNEESLLPKNAKMRVKFRDACKIAIENIENRRNNLKPERKVYLTLKKNSSIG